ncbi:hypothetical protein [Colwellia sp. UCD-KL20]|uniref:hypothetical protein n=1 Tax=Colwellia sp. UCD-KL20 TaxID=1917165 RepID=UPI0015C3CF02|nr:hypothetical protein [Colwellia sp. UCD-KL20]
MKKILLALLLVAPIATTLSGCVIAIDGDDRDHMFQNDHEREFENRKKIANMPLYP